MVHKTGGTSEGINLVFNDKPYFYVETRLPARTLPLGSYGNGMDRIFGIGLALVNAKYGMVLVDEADTSLHYSVLPDFWKLITETAHRFNVQVFATFHSRDCIQAFQQASEGNKEE